jgi:hypothetical protein
MHKAAQYPRNPSVTIHAFTSNLKHLSCHALADKPETHELFTFVRLFRARYEGAMMVTNKI